MDSNKLSHSTYLQYIIGKTVNGSNSINVIPSDTDKGITFLESSLCLFDYINTLKTTLVGKVSISPEIIIKLPISLLQCHFLRSVIIPKIFHDIVFTPSEIVEFSILADCLLLDNTISDRVISRFLSQYLNFKDLRRHRTCYTPGFIANTKIEIAKAMKEFFESLSVASQTSCVNNQFIDVIIKNITEFINDSLKSCAIEHIQSKTKLFGEEVYRVQRSRSILCSLIKTLAVINYSNALKLIIVDLSGIDVSPKVLHDLIAAINWKFISSTAYEEFSSWLKENYPEFVPAKAMLAGIQFRRDMINPETGSMWINATSHLGLPELYDYCQTLQLSPSVLGACEKDIKFVEFYKTDHEVKTIIIVLSLCDISTRTSQSVLMITPRKPHGQLPLKICFSVYNVMHDKLERLIVNRYHLHINSQSVKQNKFIWTYQRDRATQSLRLKICFHYIY